VKQGLWCVPWLEVVEKSFKKEEIVILMFERMLCLSAHMKEDGGGRNCSGECKCRELGSMQTRFSTTTELPTHGITELLVVSHPAPQDRLQGRQVFVEGRRPVVLKGRGDGSFDHGVQLLVPVF
jgi:hypothetical protein